jgi:hypothetical protein
VDILAAERRLVFAHGVEDGEFRERNSISEERGESGLRVLGGLVGVRGAATGCAGDESRGDDL